MGQKKLRKPDKTYGNIYVSGILRALIVAILVLAQILFITCLSLAMTKYTVFFYFLVELASLIVIITLVNGNSATSFKVGWISIILIMPITGHIMYVLWGSNNNKKENNRVNAIFKNAHKYLKEDDKAKEVFAEEYPILKRTSDYLSSEKFPLYKNNNIEYYPMGEKVFDAMIEDIYKAEKFILIEFFIVAEGVLWDRFHQALLERINAGVEVKFLYDDFGAMFRTNKYFKEDLEEEGFEVRVFNPIHKYLDKLYFNYRSHQKILVIDGNIGYTGGVNIADEYANIHRRFGKWKDTAIRIEGEGAWGFSTTFLQMWDISGEGTVDYRKYMPTKKFKENNSFCHIVSDGPANNPDNPIESLYRQMMSGAQKFLYITTPYLIIEEDMANQLMIAAKSGIDVRIITPFIPDKKTVKLLTNYNYGKLLRAGVKIYEYKPGFIHAKNIVNDMSAVVGSINMDYRSFYLHYECGAWMCDKKIVNTIKQDFLKTLEESVEITYEDWLKRPLRVKLVQPLINLFQTLL